MKINWFSPPPWELTDTTGLVVPGCDSSVSEGVGSKETRDDSDMRDVFSASLPAVVCLAFRFFLCFGLGTSRQAESVSCVGSRSRMMLEDEERRDPARDGGRCKRHQGHHLHGTPPHRQPIAADRPVHRTDQYTGQTSTPDRPVQQTDQYNGQTTSPSADRPVQRIYQHNGHTTSQSVRSHNLTVSQQLRTDQYTRQTSTPDRPVHRTDQHTGHPSTTDTPPHRQPAASDRPVQRIYQHNGHTT